MNEGDKFGALYKGANNPQGGNSSGHPTDNAANTSKFFGGKTRYSGRQTVSSAHMNYAAAQNVASNPNTPDFFGEAMVANNPYPVENTRKPKKGLFIAVGAALVVILAVVLVVCLLPKGEVKPDEDGLTIVDMPADFQELFTGELYDEAASFEEQMVKESTELTSIWIVLNREAYKTLEKKYQAYLELCSRLADYDASQLKQDQKKIVESIKTTVETVRPKFEKIMEARKLLVDGFMNNNSASVSKLLSSSNSYLKELAESVNNAKQRYNELNARYQANGCDSAESALCSSLAEQLGDTENIPLASGNYLDYVKSCNNSNSFSEEDIISDDIGKLMANASNKNNSEESK